ncbi:hypothetical protein E4U54_006056 [Claviceps lovelessii]|nr:hypothetical protein E4U54_006056 [Claviceps lovelessii]
MLQQKLHVHAASAELGKDMHHENQRHVQQECPRGGGDHEAKKPRIHESMIDQCQVEKPQMPRSSGHGGPVYGCLAMNVAAALIAFASALQDSKTRSIIQHEMSGLAGLLVWWSGAIIHVPVWFGV